MKKLTHLDDKGAARMVDVGDKPDTDRRAVARIAGIMAAKRTSDLIPLTHPLPLTHLAVDVELTDEGLAIQAIAATTGPTGVEMEALTAVAVAGLTLYDMLKSVERGAQLTDIRLVEKSGGKSGTYTAP